MRRISGIGLIVLGTLLLGTGRPMAETPTRGEASQRAVADALREGHWAEALQLTRLRLESGDGAPSDLTRAIQALGRLNRVEEFDALLERTVARYADNAPMLVAAAQAYSRVPKWGYRVAGELRRGSPRGGGARLWLGDRDRIAALRWGVAAYQAAADDAEAAAACEQLASELAREASGRTAWRLQSLTDLTGGLPEPLEGHQRRVSQSFAPVDAEGQPILYGVPSSWDAAESDGERLRWAWAERSRRAPDTRGDNDLAYAHFLHQQFGVQTLQQGREPLDDATIAQLAELSDEETIARLATGVRRFTLPEGSRCLELFREHEAWTTLASIYRNRDQRPRAVEALRAALVKATNKSQQKRLQGQIDQLILPWARFDPSVTQPAGEGATLRVTHRNASEIRLVARPIDVKRLLADVMALIEDLPKKTPRAGMEIERLGWRLLQEGQEKYLGEPAAAWTTQLTTPADHRDGHDPITTPLQAAGAYFVTATPTGSDGAAGAESSIALWLADTVLVRKPTAEGALYQVLDARSGEPVEGATIDLFGYRQLHHSPQGERRTRPHFDTARLAETTSVAGLAAFELAPKENEPGYSWLATATTPEGQHAHLGFASVWRQQPDADPPRNPRTFVVTDRPVYRPGDRVEFKIWIGRPNYAVAAAPEGDSEPAPSEFAHQEFKVDLYDARGEKVDSQRLTADAYGGLVGSYATPTDASLGHYRIDLVGFGGDSFRVEEYRKPEFEVTVTAPTEPTKLGEPFDATVHAAYYSGSPVRGGAVKYKVIRTRRTERWLPIRPWDWLYGRGYGWLGQDATWRSDWRQWGCYAPMPPWWPAPSGPPEVVAEGEAELDAQGRFRLTIDTAQAAARQPDDDHEYAITAEVTDAGRRTQGGAGEVLAARRPVDVTVWLDRGYYTVGDTVRANISVRRPDGEPLAGGGELRLLKITEPAAEPGGQPTETLVQAWDLASDVEGAAEMRLKASEPGRYRLVYRSDAAEEAVEGGLLFTILGPGFEGGDFRYGDLELIPDKPEYAPGETVRLLVNTNRTNATVTLFVRPVGGVYGTPEVFPIAGKNAVVEIPLTAGDMPNFFVEAHTVVEGRLHSVTREVVVPPESRVIQVEASPSAPSYLPGEEGTLRVRLTDAAGEPIAGQATIAVYDRSVEAIAGGPSGGDIRARFWDWKRHHHPSVQHSLSRGEGPAVRSGTPTMQSLGLRVGRIARGRGRGFAWGERYEFGDVAEGVMLGKTMRFAESDSAPMPAMAMAAAGGGSFGGEAPAEEPAVAVRENFADTALWVGSVETDAAGFAEVKMPLPESLTAWKVRAWAVGAGLRVGEGEAEVVTRKDLMVRLRAPRFLVAGDEVTLAALVQNESPRELTVNVRLEADGETLTLPSNAAQTVTVEAGGEMRVDWLVTATLEGDAKFRAIATVEGDAALSDGMQIELPVLVHGAEIVESFSAVIAPDERLATFELVVPEERRPEATRLEIRYSPTLVGAMLDTLPYLIEYPHGCTEQTLNRFLPAAIVRQTIRDLGVELEDLKPAGEEPAGPPRRSSPVFDDDELDKIVKSGVRRLREMQLSDGGWGWFSGFGERSSAHTTAVVVRGLGVAKRSGVAVPDDVLNRGLDWLVAYRNEQEKRLFNVRDGEVIDEDKPSKRYADNLDALIELTLSKNDRMESQNMFGFLYRDRLKLTPYSQALLGMALHHVIKSQRAIAGGFDKPGMLRTVVRNLKQYVETDDENQTAYLNLPGGYWWSWYGSEYEAHAYFLKLLAATEPKGELAPKLVKYLLANRRHATRWNSTRDTALVVEAMADYLRASGEADLEGQVEVWLDGKLRDTQAFDAASALRFDGSFVLQGEELSAGRHTLELRREGTGRLYAGASLTNFSLQDDLRAAGLEVRVTRRVQKLVPIEATDADVDSRGGVFNPKVERYRRVDVPNRGEVESGDLLEVELTIASKNDYEYLLIEDPKPAGCEPTEVRSGYRGDALGAYIEYRDQSVMLYVRNLPRGERTVRYRLRAETPGVFSALPTQIGAMYAPELRGNSDELKLRVVD
ncbi:MG2 domain protein [Planctomycetes bacterium MalM25]|nr:MG2 domain protein [Planctomycetes bacterium MalM25]